MANYNNKDFLLYYPSLLYHKQIKMSNKIIYSYYRSGAPPLFYLLLCSCASLLARCDSHRACDGVNTHRPLSTNQAHIEILN